LAEQSRRSLRYLWPTAPSRLYAEPKRLADAGLIEIEEEPAGPTRTRQRYQITAAGRRALAEWLATDPAPPRIEMEALLRAFLADAGRPDDLLAALAATREQAEASYRAGMELVQGYRAGDNPFPERLHLNLLWIAFVRDLLQLLADWSDFATGEVQAWASVTDAGAHDRLRALLDAIASGDVVIPRGEPLTAD
jgi:DNA-binding PadR family transcriptional regulator